MEAKYQELQNSLHYRFYPMLEASISSRVAISDVQNIARNVGTLEDASCADDNARSRVCRRVVAEQTVPV